MMKLYSTLNSIENSIVNPTNKNIRMAKSQATYFSDYLLTINSKFGTKWENDLNSFIKELSLFFSTQVIPTLRIESTSELLEEHYTNLSKFLKIIMDDNYEKGLKDLLLLNEKFKEPKIPIKQKIFSFFKDTKTTRTAVAVLVILSFIYLFFWTELDTNTIIAIYALPAAIYYVLAILYKKYK